MQSVKRLCEQYLEGFGSESTGLVYHHRLNGPRGLEALESPDQIAQGLVNGKEVPYGYGSGIQDVALENGHLLFALCEAYEATGDPDLADLARRIFAGIKRVATVSPVPGFVPRGPHPDGKSYYRDSSMDQHTTFVYSLWRYHRSALATAEDKVFIADALGKVARRLEQYGWSIQVEDGSRQAHVGFSWLQLTRTGATVLLAVLAAVKEATGDAHWQELYDRYGAEKDGLRWRLLTPDSPEPGQPFTLYSNQFAVGLAVLASIETDEGRLADLNGYRRQMAERMLQSNVFDEAQWRRLDWADNWPDQANAPDGWAETETQKLLDPFGLSPAQPTTVVDLYARFDPRAWASDDSRLRKVNGKLCFGFPTVAFHTALLSGEQDLADDAAPHVRSMVEQMLAHGELYTHGEDFNRAVVLGLHLLAATEGAQ